MQRRLAALIPEGTAIDGGALLELSAMLPQDRPKLDPSELVEDRRVTAHSVSVAPVAHFAAFLDGTQTSRVARYVSNVPIVYSSVAAVIRARRDRRMVTWERPIVHQAVYAPFAVLPAATQAALRDTDLEVVDTTATRELDSLHPFMLQDAALSAVNRARVRVERMLAEAWCERADGELFIDGGISESEAVARSSRVVGVVKSHRTLYVDGDDLNVILSLRPGERSSVTRVVTATRTPVASWYLRLRGSSGRDPLWGLVRIEIAEPARGGKKAVVARADEVSSWVLAEALPLAVPDGRWDKMVYGIRDCEEFLRAIQ